MPLLTVPINSHEKMRMQDILSESCLQSFNRRRTGANLVWVAQSIVLHLVRPLLDMSLVAVQDKSSVRSK